MPERLEDGARLIWRQEAWCSSRRTNAQHSSLQRQLTDLGIFRWGHRTRAIFLASTGTLIIVIDGSGECHMRHSNAVDFVLNNVVPTSVAMEAFKTVSLANSEITNAPLETLTGDARRARVACVHALSRVEMQQEHATAELVKAGAARMHAFLLDKVENTASMTWESHKGVEWLLGQGKSTPIRVWAMHDMLVDDPDRFVLEATAPRTSTFRLRSKASVNAARQVQEWLSNDSHIIKQFIDKARQVISLSRQNPPTPTPLALRPIPHHLAWAKEETVLLALIRSTAASSRSLQGAPGEHHVAALMKMTGLYKEFNQQLGWPLQPFDRRAAVLFLRELGVLPPWQSPTLFDRSVHISKAWPIPTLAFSPEDATQKSFDGQPTHHKPVVEERHCADRLGDVRRDFGDMPVYVIDDASARELDDGISVESIDDDSAWLHVHVADPTATLTVNGYAAKLAAFRMTSIYNLGIQLPMLSTEMVESEGWSLGGGSGGIDRAGQRTLTFSARIDRRTGEILEHRVEAGVIRNVNILTYTQVAEIIGWPTPERVQIRVGPEPPGGWPAGSPQRAACSPEDVANLKLLEVYHDALKRSRMASGSMEWFVAKTDVKVHAAPIPVFYSPPAPRLWQGMPSFSLSLPPQWNEVDRLSWSSAEAQPLVSEFMILAGRVAALFSRERGLVMPYRGQLAPDLEPSALAEIKATAGNTGGPSLGACDFISIARHRVNLAAGAHSPSPIQHFPLGLQDGYVRATSPLRRYGDLAVHWSIKRALHPKNSPVPPAACLRPVEMRNLVRLLDSKGKDLSVLEGRFNAAWIACGIKETMRQLATDRAAVDPVVAARFDNLFGIVLQDAMLWSATNVIAIRMILPELGVRASLMSDGTEHWHKPWLRRNDTSTPTSMVGLSVPVKILSISADDHVAVRLDKSRMHELHMIP